MAITRNHTAYREAQRPKKKTSQGCGQYSKGHKKYRGQGGPRKRVKLPK